MTDIKSVKQIRGRTTDRGLRRQIEGQEKSLSVGNTDIGSGRQMKGQEE